MDTQAAAWPCRKSTAAKRYRLTGITENPAWHGHYLSLVRSARDLKRLRNRTQLICSPATRTGLSRPRAGALTAASSYGYTGGSKGEDLLTQGLRRRRARGGRRWLGEDHGGEVRRRGRRRRRGGGRQLAIDSLRLDQTCKIGMMQMSRRSAYTSARSRTTRIRGEFDLAPARPWRKNRGDCGLPAARGGEVWARVGAGRGARYIAP